MGYVSPTVSYAEVTSTLGTGFWIRADSASDYVLDPAFLRFLIISIGIYALLTQGDGSPQLVGWQLPFHWLAVAGMVLVGHIATLNLLFHLSRRGMVRRHYTPVIFVPILILAEATGQAVFWLLDVAAPQPLHLMLGDLARNLLVLFLFDLLHVHYVVPTHPLAHLTRPEPGTASDSPPPRAEDTPPTADQDHPTVQIADRAFALSDLLSIRTEDHYLNVISHNGRCMLRAKLSDITPLHDGRHGVQINRSHWVSFAAIERITEDSNGQITLHLVGGDSATVSRTRRLMFMQLYNATKTSQA